MNSTAKPCVLYYECLQYDEANLTLLNELFTVHAIPDPRYDESYSQTMKNRIQAIFLPLGFSFGVQQMSKFPLLRVIASNTTTQPDVAPEVRRNIEVVWLVRQGFLDKITATSEHALGLMHAVHRNTLGAYLHVLAGGWRRYNFGAPKMLSRMNALVWGHGRVGKHLVLRARPLFNNVSYIEEANGQRFIDKKLATADVLFLTMSISGDQPVVGRVQLERLPRSAIVVNVARGECLDTLALLDLLGEGKLGGAALDVLPGDHAFPFQRWGTEHYAAVSYAKEHDNLIITPHIAGSTEDAWHETQSYVIDKVKEILSVECAAAIRGQGDRKCKAHSFVDGICLFCGAQG